MFPEFGGWGGWVREKGRWIPPPSPVHRRPLHFFAAAWRGRRALWPVRVDDGRVAARLGHHHDRDGLLQRLGKAARLQQAGAVKLEAALAVGAGGVEGGHPLARRRKVAVAAQVVDAPDARV